MATVDVESIIVQLSLEPKNVEALKRAENALLQLEKQAKNAKDGSMEFIDAMKKTIALERQLGRETTVAKNSIAGLEKEINDLIEAQRRVNLSTQRGRKDFKALGKEIERHQKRLNDLNGATNGQGNALAGMAKKAGPALAALFAVDQVITYGKELALVTAKYEKFEAVLTNTLGNRSEAQKALNQIQDFAAKTPFQVDELTDSFIKLANSGFRPTTQELTKLGDLAASKGKSFNQLTEAIIDAQTFEFERLKEFGIRAQQNGNRVAFTFKGVRTEVDRTSEAVKEYILSLGELDGVSGGMEAVSKTLAGQLSNLSDTFEKLQLTIGRRFSAFFSNLVSQVSSAMQTLTEAFELSNTEVKDAALANNTLANSGKALLDRYKELTKDGVEPTVEQKAELTQITEQLRMKFGDSVVSINKETKAYQLNVKAVEQAIRSRILLANADAQTLVVRANNAKREEEIARQRLQANEETVNSISDGLRQEGVAINEVISQYNAEYEGFVKSREMSLNRVVSFEEKALRGLTDEQKEAIRVLSQVTRSNADLENSIASSSEAYQDAMKALKESGFTEEDYNNLFNPEKVDLGGTKVKTATTSDLASSFKKDISDTVEQIRLDALRAQAELEKDPLIRLTSLFDIDQQELIFDFNKKITDFKEKALKSGASKQAIADGVQNLNDTLGAELAKLTDTYNNKVNEILLTELDATINVKVDIDVEVEEEGLDQEFNDLQSDTERKLSGVDRQFQRQRVRIDLEAARSGDREQELKDRIKLEEGYLRKRLETMKALMGSSVEIEQFEADQLNTIQDLKDSLEQLEEQSLKRRKQVYMDFADSVKNALNGLFDLQISKIDEEVSYRQDRIKYLEGLQSESAEKALQEEEQRQAEALQERERFVRAQQIIGAIEAGVNIFTGITRVFAESGVASLGTLPAVLGVLTAVLAGVPALVQPLLGFKDGVIDFKGRGTETSDSNVVAISNRESVITAKGTKNAPKALEMINKGMLTDAMVFPKFDPVESANFAPAMNLLGDTKAMEQKLSKNNALLAELLAKMQSPTYVDYRFDENGFSKRMKRQNRRAKAIDNLR